VAQLKISVRRLALLIGISRGPRNMLSVSNKGRLMARYASTEKHYECCRCHITCTRREMKKKGMIFRCPNCDMLMHVQSTRYLTNG